MTEYNNQAKTDDADVEQYNTLNTRAHTHEIKFNQKQTTSSGKKVSRNVLSTKKAMFGQVIMRNVLIV